MSTAIEFEHVSKQYRLGLVSTKTLSHDIRRFWINEYSWERRSVSQNRRDE